MERKNGFKEIDDKWGEIAYDLGTLEAMSDALNALSNEPRNEREAIGCVERLIREVLLPQITQIRKKHDELERLIWNLKKEEPQPAAKQD